MRVFRATVRHRLPLIVVGLLCIAGGGCIPISAHRGADLSKADQFKIEKNKTTESELVEQFGQPTTTTTQSDGTKNLIWSGGTGSTHVNVAAMLIPFAWVADPQSTKVSHQSLMATIRNGVVIDYTLSNGNQEY